MSETYTVTNVIQNKKNTNQNQYNDYIELSDVKTPLNDDQKYTINEYYENIDGYNYNKINYDDMSLSDMILTPFNKVLMLGSLIIISILILLVLKYK